MSRLHVATALVVLGACGGCLLPATAFAKDAPATDISVGGVSASITQAHGGDRDAQAVAYGLASSHIGFGYESPFTVRALNTGWFGAGTHGIQGGISNAFSGGPRLNLGKDQGVFLRFGIEGAFFGNQYLWDSLLELPQLQLGWQWLVPHQVIDFAAKGGYILWGRHNTGDSAMRELDASLEAGGQAALHLGPADLHAGYTHAFIRGGGRPIDMFDGNFCSIVKRLAICTSVRYEFGDEVVPSGELRFARVSFVGLTVGTLIDRLRIRKKR